MILSHAVYRCHLLPISYQDVQELLFKRGTSVSHETVRALFQSASLGYRAWVRCKVSQKGGMGVLERLNTAYKYKFALRQAWDSLSEVQTALPNVHS